MAAPGPIPKRAAQRLGHRTKAEQAAVSTVKVVGAVKMPSVDRKWHPIARDWYRSLGQSGQHQTYEPSDWQAARLVAAEMTRMLNDTFISPTMFKAIWSAMSELLTTEGARRRVKLEVDRKPMGPAPAPVAKMDDFKALYG